MDLFGKEININIDKKQTKLLIITGTAIGIIIVVYFLVISPIGKIFDKKEELLRVKQEKISTEQNLKLFEKRYERVKVEREAQKYRLEKLLEEFRQHSFKDEARLKQMIQDILDYLNIELLEIGKTETMEIEENKEYQRKTIPYKISGNGRDIGLFFYYLENSKALLTLKKSRLEVAVKPFNEGDKKIGLVEVKFKLGYYNITAENEGGNDEN
ncbi:MULTISPECIES: hypothetical protein [Psychrilyobacter]|uniref:Type IV pilus assembly protein PilO n=1 Tax=Psychrilyobacter piezotolerans TaxID=2293438 RepID=A0ABX9KGJ7_9FUSO|nr:MULTISPECIES: hypothetical protein [Psychrilyobacter]MCS5420339.1 hypothetical protein [Psychrilyobacter sp. S5]NDI78079.1 hypothetical protein [Psychrilyobacter piezotolerans]RDE61670.1 hypothetical protein DV867_08480 [Psychrilyobacter sp. S5]REI41062.1 hypothetical protein DYH56_08480 [Psychrilyobacter piezotolerans]